MSRLISGFFYALSKIWYTGQIRSERAGSFFKTNPKGRRYIIED